MKISIAKYVSENGNRYNYNINLFLQTQKKVSRNTVFSIYFLSNEIIILIAVTIRKQNFLVTHNLGDCSISSNSIVFGRFMLLPYCGVVTYVCRNFHSGLKSCVSKMVSIISRKQVKCLQTDG